MMESGVGMRRGSAAADGEAAVPAARAVALGGGGVARVLRVGLDDDACGNDVLWSRPYCPAFKSWSGATCKSCRYRATVIWM